VGLLFPLFITQLVTHFRRHHLCGYDLNLTYPQNGIIPGPKLIPPAQRNIPFSQTKLTQNNVMGEIAQRYSLLASQDKSLSQRDSEVSRSLRKRNLSGRSNGSIDPWVSDLKCLMRYHPDDLPYKYGCFLLHEFVDYAVNFTFPWRKSRRNDVKLLYSLMPLH
jgi:carboxypeptidase D